MKLCPIHRTSLFLSDGWESVELHDDVLFFELAFLFLVRSEVSQPISRTNPIRAIPTSKIQIFSTIGTLARRENTS
jgi:hypothetical protein